MEKIDPQDDGREEFEPVRGSSVALLTTFRLNSQSVGTPVGISLERGKAYFMTRMSTGKVRRIANDPRVTLAPCTSSGKVVGLTVEGVACRMEEQEAERREALKPTAQEYNAGDASSASYRFYLDMLA